MSSPSLFLKINDFNGYDEFYVKIDTAKPKNKSILENIENAIEQKYIDNNLNFDGVSLEMEFTYLTEEQCKEIDWNEE